LSYLNFIVVTLKLHSFEKFALIQNIHKEALTTSAQSVSIKETRKNK